MTREEKIAEMKARLRAMLHRDRTAKRVEAWPPPRYDDIFFKGVEWLDKNG